MDINEVEKEIVEIRERLVKIEVTLDNVQRSVERDKGGGAVVVPVAAVVAVAEIIRLVLERAV